MANTFTQSMATVFGDMRVITGTLSCDDGNGGLAVDTGLNQIFWVGVTSSQMARMTYSAGEMAPCTAASGASYQCLVVGK